MTVSRETVQALATEHGLPYRAAQRLLTQANKHDLHPEVVLKLALLLAALAAEPAPPTAVTDPSEAIDVHIADGLSGLEAPPLLRATRIADLGAGAGFPGLVLAAALPNTQVDLIESTARKCEVIARLATAAGITNATPVPARAEEWASTEGARRYDAVTARALSSLAVLTEYAAPLLEPDGTLIAWKGARDPDEEHAGTAAAELLGLTAHQPIPVRPFKGSRERNLYIYTKTAPTPDRFPRRPGMATKRPLS